MSQVAFIFAILGFQVIFSMAFNPGVWHYLRPKSPWRPSWPDFLRQILYGPGPILAFFWTLVGFIVLSKQGAVILEDLIPINRSRVVIIGTMTVLAICGGIVMRFPRPGLRGEPGTGALPAPSYVSRIQSPANFVYLNKERIELLYDQTRPELEEHMVRVKTQQVNALSATVGNLVEVGVDAKKIRESVVDYVRADKGPGRKLVDVIELLLAQGGLTAIEPPQMLTSEIREFENITRHLHDRFGVVVPTDQADTVRTRLADGALPGFVQRFRDIQKPVLFQAEFTVLTTEEEVMLSSNVVPRRLELKAAVSRKNAEDLVRLAREAPQLLTIFGWFQTPLSAQALTTVNLLPAAVSTGRLVELGIHPRFTPGVDAPPGGQDLPLPANWR